MLAVDFPGTNVTLCKPCNMTDEQCMEVRAFQAVDVAGFPFILTAWMPNKEDLEAINAGRPIMLKVLGAMAPPVAIFTYNENYDANV